MNYPNASATHDAYLDMHEITDHFPAFDRIKRKFMTNFKLTD